MAKKSKATLEKVASKVDGLALTVNELTSTTDKLATLMVGGFESIHNDVGELRGNMTQVKRDISAMRDDVEEIKLELRGHGKAIDADTKLLLNHETRIKKLEHAR